MEVKLTIDSSPMERPRPAKIMTNKLDFLKKQILPALLKNPNGAPFLVPVNPKLLNIPDYPRVIKCPIDISKIKNRLHSKYYYDSNECLADFKLMFCNCFLYNLPDSEVVHMGLSLFKLYNEKIKLMPNDEYTIAANKRNSDGSTKKSNKFASSVVKINDLSPVGSPHNSTNSVGRNQRRMDSSCYDMSSSPSPTQSNCGKIKSEDHQNKRPRLSEDLRICLAILKELTSVRHRHLNEIFLEPVVQKFPNLVDYLDIIKYPMDLGTIRDNLDNHRYKVKEDFVKDVALMFDNCYAYNGLESSVSQLARDLQKIFDETYSKAFKLNKPLIPIPAGSSIGAASAISNNTMTPIIPNTVHSALALIKNETYTNPDLKSTLDNINKEMKNIVNAISAVDSKVRKLAESHGESYESPLMGLLNGSYKRQAKKRKANSSGLCIDTNSFNVTSSLAPGPASNGTTSSNPTTTAIGNLINTHKRGRKSHHQKMLIQQHQQQQQQQQGAFYTASLINNNHITSTSKTNHIPTSNNSSSITGNLTHPIVSTITNNNSTSNGLYVAPSVTQQIKSSPAVVYPQQTNPALSVNNNINNSNNNPNQLVVYPPSQPQVPQLQQPIPSNDIIQQQQQHQPDYTSYDARRNLSIMIEKLSGKQLGQVIDIIKENEAAYSNWNLDELDIDFEVLQPITLKHLYNYVESIEPPITLFDVPGSTIPSGIKEVPEEGQISDSSSNSSESSSDSSESDSESES